MGYSKIIYGDKVLMDLTGDTVAADTLLRGATAHGKDGERIAGSCSYDVDSSDATVEVAEMLLGKTAYARGQKLVGTMLNNGGVAGQISTKAGKYTVPIGYHDGSGEVQIAPEEQAKLVPANIRQGIEVLGVRGTMTGMESIKAQTKTITPKTTAQSVNPDAGYNYLSGVTVAAIPYAEAQNAAGGTTVTIAG